MLQTRHESIIFDGQLLLATEHAPSTAPFVKMLTPTKHELEGYRSPGVVDSADDAYRNCGLEWVCRGPALSKKIQVHA